MGGGAMMASVTFRRCVFDIQMGTSLERDDIRFCLFDQVSFWVVGVGHLIVGGHGRCVKSCLSGDCVPSGIFKTAKGRNDRNNVTQWRQYGNSSSS